MSRSETVLNGTLLGPVEIQPEEKKHDAHQMPSTQNGNFVIHIDDLKDWDNLVFPEVG